jgi:hypothetical protein
LLNSSGKPTLVKDLASLAHDRAQAKWLKALELTIKKKKEGKKGKRTFLEVQCSEKKRKRKEKLSLIEYCVH